MHFSFYLEKVPGEGEDSEPLLMVGRDRSVVGTFDGLGGAGGTIYDTPSGRHAGAWFAARVALDVVQGHLAEIVGPGPELDGPRVAEVLRDRLREALTRRLAEFGAPKSTLRSRLLRALPTTMALAYLVRTEPDGTDWTCHCFWAGDSRMYAVDPEDGAQQLTADDLRSSNDALQNLVDDSVMDNCVSADTDFHINYRRLDLREPFMLVSATDGCFGYVPSPMHFEHMILTHLQAAASVDGWRAGLRSATEAVTGDDATMALLAVGGDFEAIRTIFAARLEALRKTYIEPLDDIEAQTRKTVQRADELRQQRLALRSELWSRYKTGYERFLVEPVRTPPPSPAGGPTGQSAAAGADEQVEAGSVGEAGTATPATDGADEAVADEGPGDEETAR